LAFALFWGAAFTLSCRLSVLDPDPGVARGGFAAALVGKGRSVLGAGLFQTADVYFHRGATDVRKHDRPEGFFVGLRDRVAPRDHVHAEGIEVAEIMPWLALSIRADPRNVETYLVSAFWLAHAAKRPDLALNVLNRAQQANPGDYRVQIEKGRLFLQEGRFDLSRSAFDAALAFWPGLSDPAAPEALYDRAEALLYRALLHEEAGEVGPAIACLEAYLTIYPERHGVAQRLADLRAGSHPERLASEFWDAMLTADRKSRSTCPHEDHDHESEHGGHE
jgi:tetratricopeptide (TPR) repeat protein